MSAPPGGLEPPALVPRLRKGERADVALLLEGTYPYVSGGVASWVHQIISGLPDLRFALVFLGSQREQYGKMKYKLPDNVVHLDTHFIMEPWRFGLPQRRKGSAHAFADMAKLHDYFREPAQGTPHDLIRRVWAGFGKASGISPEDFLYSEQSWNRIREDYERYCTDPSFVDYFWTVRTMHAPLFTLAKIAHDGPDARVWHSISTGYAGLLGAMLKILRGGRYILTEHGIYTKERKIDLAHAEWIKDAREAFGGGLDDDVSYIRRLWIRFFEGLGRLAYDVATPIVSLYAGSRVRQIADGADERRTRIIPNGIDFPRFSALRSKRPADIPKVMGLLGRVVPIKDIRTFIRAARTVCTRLPEAEAWIIGPDDEDKAYAGACRDLVENLGLVGKVKFLGFQKPDDVLPKIGVMLLTSISEALPLVVLEGAAAGVPSVTTDVGACRELIEGGTEEDRALGPSGIVVPIADPEATANAVLALLTDPERWHKAQAAGATRVERYYTQTQMYASYRAVYEEALEDSRGGDRVRAS